MGLVHSLKKKNNENTEKYVCVELDTFGKYLVFLGHVKENIFTLCYVVKNVDLHTMLGRRRRR